MGYLIIKSTDNSTFEVPASGFALSLNNTPNYTLTDVFVGYIDSDTGELCTDPNIIFEQDVPSISNVLVTNTPIKNVELEQSGYVYKIKICISANISTEEKNGRLNINSIPTGYAKRIGIKLLAGSSGGGTITPTKYELVFTTDYTGGKTWAKVSSVPSDIQTLIGYTGFVYYSKTGWGATNNTLQAPTTSFPLSTNGGWTVMTLTKTQYDNLVTAGYGSKQSIGTILDADDLSGLPASWNWVQNAGGYLQAVQIIGSL